MSLKPRLVFFRKTFHFLERIVVGKISANRNRQEHINAVYLSSFVPWIPRFLKDGIGTMCRYGQPSVSGVEAGVDGAVVAGSE